jgi:hypothetical protein
MKFLVLLHYIPYLSVSCSPHPTCNAFCEIAGWIDFAPVIGAEISFDRGRGVGGRDLADCRDLSIDISPATKNLQY